MTLRVKARGKILQISGVYRGIEVRQSTKLPKDKMREAQSMKAKIERKIDDGAFTTGRQAQGRSQVTFREVADSYVTWKTAEGKDGREILGRSRRFCTYWGHRTAADITTGDVMVWVSEAMGHLAPGSVLRYLNSFKAMMNHAYERGWLVQKLRVPLPHVDDARDEHFDEAEVDSFLAWVQANAPEHELNFTLLIDSGLRLGEAVRLTWRDIKFSDDVIVVRKKTHGKARMRKIPISNELGALLGVRAAEGVTPSEAVVVGKRGHSWSDANAASAGLGDVLKRGCRAIGLEPLRVHDLRHTFAYLAAKGGADLGDLQDLMGHEKIEMTLRYRGFMPNRSRAVIKNLRGNCARNMQDTSSQILHTTPETTYPSKEVAPRVGERDDKDTPN